MQSTTFCDGDTVWGADKEELGVIDSMMPFFIVIEQFLRILPLRTSTTWALVRRYDEGAARSQGLMAEGATIVNICASVLFWGGGID